MQSLSEDIDFLYTKQVRLRQIFSDADKAIAAIQQKKIIAHFQTMCKTIDEANAQNCFLKDHFDELKRGFEELKAKREIVAAKLDDNAQLQGQGYAVGVGTQVATGHALAHALMGPVYLISAPLALGAGVGIIVGVCAFGYLLLKNWPENRNPKARSKEMMVLLVSTLDVLAGACDEFGKHTCALAAYDT